MIAETMLKSPETIMLCIPVLRLVGRAVGRGSKLRHLGRRRRRCARRCEAGNKALDKAHFNGGFFLYCGGEFCCNMLSTHEVSEASDR